MGHEAGQDLTEALTISSHGDSVVASMKLVGTLV
jgi:predicted heme/steroid binding protein